MDGRKIMWNTRHKMRSLVDVYPMIYLSLCRLRPQIRELVAVRDTELVIEGFPRSANTFAVAAFRFAQQRPVKIARHLHAPAQIIAAARMRIPTLVLIRYPEDTMLSLLIRSPFLSAEQALKDYIHFYTTIMPYRESYVLAKYDDVIQDFGLVIQAINTRFGTSFHLFEHTAENVNRCFRIIEQMDKENTNLASVKETTVARPSEERARMKQHIRTMLQRRKTAVLLEEAQEMYERMTTGHNLLRGDNLAYV